MFIQYYKLFCGVSLYVLCSLMTDIP